jgi:hypothetical protein
MEYKKFKVYMKNKYHNDKNHRDYVIRKSIARNKALTILFRRHKKEFTNILKKVENEWKK